ncbi:hypothetical protein [Fimbriiglobus ruber]|uniref:hypothetical protein n=1 Tax=Fimbriiglobus ruber TaxID=1908690 RepID=UPI001179BE26|nr:hypothetical protein [Fimbriiglobus ruber]
MADATGVTKVYEGITKLDIVTGEEKSTANRISDTITGTVQVVLTAEGIRQVGGAAGGPKPKGSGTRSQGGSVATQVEPSATTNPSAKLSEFVVGAESISDDALVHIANPPTEVNYSGQTLLNGLEGAGYYARWGSVKNRTLAEFNKDIAGYGAQVMEL